MRHVLLALLPIAFVLAFAPPASAQSATGIPLNQDKDVSPEQRAKRRATEEAYKSTMKGIPDAKPVDPWGNVRGAETPQSGAKAKAKRK